MGTPSLVPVKTARAFGADMVVMGGLAADHAAERDKAVKTLAGSRHCGDGRRNLERSGDGDAFVAGACCGNRHLGATPQLGGDVGVIGRLDEK